MLPTLAVLTTALLLSLDGVAQTTQRFAQGPASPDMHNSRNSLDWSGTYEGILPCADCPGIRTILTLTRDGAYVLTTNYIERPVAPARIAGRFAWQPSGNAITLDAAGGERQFQVREGSLAPIYPGASGSMPPARVLARVPDRVAATGAALLPTLESFRWTLASAVDAGGKALAGFPSRDGPPAALEFAGGRVSAYSGCNRIGGAVGFDAGGRLEVGRTITTNMACEPQLMSADAALVALLGEPLQVAVDTGSAPRLRLISPTEETLLWNGVATPESLYGAPATIFLEVAARDIECAHPMTGKMRCLQVRERKFDAQGLRVDPPGEWQAFFDKIAGYNHEEGVRNVLRVKRFTRPQPPADASKYVYVLDLVVESEIVKM